VNAAKNIQFSSSRAQNLKEHSHEKFVEIIASKDRFGPNKGTRTFFKFLKLFVKKHRLFMWGRS
jgi:hypothetical protein